MDTLKCISYKIFTLFFISLMCAACSQERPLKNEIYVYQWNDKIPVKTISLSEIKDGKTIKTFSKNVEVKKQYDNLNKIPYLLLSFKDAPGFYIDRNYELKINTSVYKINDFKTMPKNQGGNIMYMMNGEPQEIGDDNIIKIEAGK